MNLNLSDELNTALACAEKLYCIEWPDCAHEVILAKSYRQAVKDLAEAQDLLTFEANEKVHAQEQFQEAQAQAAVLREALKQIEEITSNGAPFHGSEAWEIATQTLSSEAKIRELEAALKGQKENK